MSFITILLVAFSLALDAFAVSMAMGSLVKKLSLRQALFISGVFGCFQGGMPLLGWLLGQVTYRFISVVDYWIAFGLLLAVGGHMIIQAMQSKHEALDAKNPLELKTLITLAVATSIDAFAIGITFSMLRQSIVLPMLVIGLVTMALTFAGVYFGKLFQRFNEKRIEVAGGLVLVGMGLKMLISHLIQHYEMFGNSQTVWFAFVLTLIAGLATGIGSIIAFFSRQTGDRRFSFLLGMSTGLLLWIAFRELLPPVGRDMGDLWPATLLFFVGFAGAGLIDKLVPDFGNPHEPLRLEDLTDKPEFRRTGMPAVLAMVAHSFPEGLALFVVALQAPPAVAIVAALGVALHNIPEGIATAVPMYYATGSRSKACWFSSLTGLAEPLGALLMYTLLYRFLNGPMLHLLTAGSSGVLVFIALDGLLPAASVYGKYHHALYGVLLGLLISASFCLFLT